MLGFFVIVIIAVGIIVLLPIFEQRKEKDVQTDQKYSVQMKKLWSIAQTSMKERKPLRAEKALLTILKFDEKNAAAYNRLGILYAKEQKYDEAIECFEIAQSLDSNASCLHNVGLIYLETGAYEKAEMAFLQAIKMESDIATRYIALSKAQEKLGKRKQALEALEKSYELSPSVSTLRQILAIYEATGDNVGIAEATARIEQRMTEDAKKRAEETKAKERKVVATRRRIVAARKTPKIVYPKTVRRTRKTKVTSGAQVNRATVKKPPTRRGKVI